MLVHIVADHPNKISDLRPLFGSRHVITSTLLYGKDRLPQDCDAMIAAADLRNAENIAALKTVSTAFKSARRKVFVVDQKARLDAAQAYALGATHVLFNPVNQPTLLAALGGPGKPPEPAGDADRVAREAALEGAVCLDSMFSRVATGQQVDAAEAKRAAAKIADAVGENGFTHWLETVRRHHEGTYQHCLLVTGTAAAFGLSLGLARADLERLSTAAMFHDVGKAKIPSAVLDKPGRLDDRERALIETHAAAGYDALKGAGGISPEILDAVRHHHEYLDGSGYPDRLSAADIADLVRVLTISDIFSALIEDRRYKPPMSRAQAFDILTGMQDKLEMPLVTAFKSVALNR